jgi:molybdenum cofactor cytidylyltransferase
MLEPELRVAAVVLAAGMSTRMGSNKLLAEIEGEPLVRRVVRSIEASRARPIVVVTGHDAGLIRHALADTETMIVHNPGYRDGLSASLRTGIRAVAECDGAIVLLGDMPRVSSALIDKMISAFDLKSGRVICVAAHNGRRGNPVLFDRQFFPELEALSGDIGARNVVAQHQQLVCQIEADDDGPLVDIDTPEELKHFVRPHE